MRTLRDIRFELNRGWKDNLNLQASMYIDSIEKAISEALRLGLDETPTPPKAPRVSLAMRYKKIKSADISDTMINLLKDRVEVVSRVLEEVGRAGYTITCFESQQSGIDLITGERIPQTNETIYHVNF